MPDTQSILSIYNIHFRLTRVLLFKSSFHTKQKILLSCHDSDNSWVFFYSSFSKWLNYFTAYQLWSNSTVHTQAKLPPQIMGVGYGNNKISTKDVKLLFPMCLTSTWHRLLLQCPIPAWKILHLLTFCRALTYLTTRLSRLMTLFLFLHLIPN